MDQFLEKQELPQLIKYEMDNLNIPIIIKEIEFITKKFPQNKSLGPVNFNGEFYQTFK